MEKYGHRGAAWGVLGAAFVLLGCLVSRGTAQAAPDPHSALSAPSSAVVSLVHGRVLWQGSEKGVADVGLEVTDPQQDLVVATGRSDATGWYTLTVGTGNWLVNVPSTERYYGYAQEVTVLPHQDYLVDFAVRVRPAGDLVQPPAPSAAPPATTVPASTANATPAAGTMTGDGQVLVGPSTSGNAGSSGSLPPSGNAANTLAGWLLVGTAAAGLIVVGWRLRQQDQVG